MSSQSETSVSHLRLALTLGPLIAVGPLAIDTYLPALPAMAASYGATVTAVERSISIYVMGAALGQFLGGPLSDHLGRRPVALGGLLMFAVASFLISQTSSLWQLDVLRLIQALGGGATVVVAGASVRDWFDGREAARVLSSIGLITLLAPLAAPALGSVLLLLAGWEAIFLALTGYAVLMMVWISWKMPVRPPAALDRRLRDIAKGWGRVVSHRRAMMIILTNGLAFSCLFAFITDSAFVYLHFYEVSEHQFPLLFGANVITMMTFNRLNVVLLRRYQARPLVALALGIQLTATLILLTAALVSSKPALWLTVPLLMIAGGSVAMVIPNAIAAFTHYFPHDSGAATGINGSLQFLLAGLVGMLLTAFHNHSLVPLATAMVLSSGLASVVFHLGTKARPGEES